MSALDPAAAGNAAHGWPTDTEPPDLGSAWGTAPAHATAELRCLWDAVLAHADLIDDGGFDGGGLPASHTVIRLREIVRGSRKRCGL